MAPSRRKKLKQPDEFVSRGQQILDWIAAREKWVLAIVGGLVAAIVLTYGTRALLRHQLDSNFARLDEGMRLAERPVGADTVESLEELERLEKEGKKRFASEDEKWKAVGEALERVQPRLSRRAAELMASFYRGEAARQGGDYEKAIARYEDYAKQTEKDPFLRPLALYNLAVARMDAGQYEGALGDLKEARASSDDLGSLGSSILIAQALCEARLGQMEAAKQTLEDLDTQYTVAADSLGSAVQEAALAMGAPDAFGTPLLPKADEPSSGGGGEESAGQGE